MDPAAQPSHPPQAPPRPFGAAQAWIIFFAYIGVQLALGFAIGFVGAVSYAVRHHGKVTNLAESLRLPIALGALAGIVVAGWVAYVLARRAARRDLYRPSLALFGWSASTTRALLTGALAGLALGVTYMALVAVFPPPQGGKLGLVARTVTGGGWPLYAWAIFAVAIAPPVEEFVFRGVMWTGLRRSWGPVASGFAITFAFVLLHVSEAGGYPLALVAIASLGLAALAARVVSGSLFPAMLLHAGYNSVVVGVVLGGSA